MSEFTMDRLVSDFAGVLSAMTESEKVLLERVRRLRLAQLDGGRAHFEPSFSRASVTHRVTPASNAAAATTGTAATAPSSADNTSSSWHTQPESVAPAYKPAYEQSPAAAAAGHRDYDYFAELDEKLTGLRQRYLE